MIIYLHTMRLHQPVCVSHRISTDPRKLDFALANANLLLAADSPVEAFLNPFFVCAAVRLSRIFGKFVVIRNHHQCMPHKMCIRPAVVCRIKPGAPSIASSSYKKTIVEYKE